jgi:hypothetical protein
VFDKVLAVMTAEAERMLAEEMQVEKMQKGAERRRAKR